MIVNINRQVAFRLGGEIFRARQEFRSTLRPGEVQDAVLLINTVSKTVEGIIPGRAIINTEGSPIRGFVIRVKGPDPDIPILDIPILLPPGLRPGDNPFCLVAP